VPSATSRIYAVDEDARSVATRQSSRACHIDMLAA
jgi:hypothetical protein